MRIVCLDLEGVLIPEIWIGVAEQTGIDESLLIGSSRKTERTQPTTRREPPPRPVEKPSRQQTASVRAQNRLVDGNRLPAAWCRVPSEGVFRPKE